MGKFSRFLGVLLAICLLAGGAAPTPVEAATVLQPGDLAIIGFNADGPDGFSFVLLVDVSAGTQVHITDNGWLGTGGFRPVEGTITWSPMADMPAGTVVTIQDTDIVPMSFSILGDQLFIYQGTEAAPQLIFGFNDNERADMTPGWEDDAVNNNTSALPPTLTEGLTAVSVPEVDNIIYTGPVSGSRAQLLAEITDPANWTGDDGTVFPLPPVASFTVITGPDAPPSVLSTEPANLGANLAVDAGLSIVFSEAVDTTAGWLSVHCSKGGPMAYYAEADPAGASRWQVTPLAEFQPGEMCTAQIDPSKITDLDGDPQQMAAAYSWAFSTAGLRIHDIQSAAHRSPYEGWQVEDVPGLVTALASNGFYLQESLPDSDPATSQGLFVYTGSAPTVSAGDCITASGVVSEYRPGGAAENLTITQLVNPVLTPVVPCLWSVEPLEIGSTGRIPPAAIIDNDSSGDAETTPVFDPAEDGLDFYESLEGMLVRVPAAQAVGPTNLYGELPVVSSAAPDAGLRTARGGIIAQAGDFNPERIILDDGLIGSASMPQAAVGAVFTDPPVGVMSYSFGNYKLLLTEVPALEPLEFEAQTAANPDVRALRVASLNVENLSPGAAGARFAALAGIIVNSLHSPDIIGLQEVQDDSGSANNGVVSAGLTLQTLLDAISDAGGPTYAYRQIDPLDLADGGEPGGNIRVAFLFRPDRVTFVDRPGGDAVTAVKVQANPLDGSPQLSLSPGRIEPLHAAFADSRKPLAAEFQFGGRSVFVVVNHFNSKSGDDPLFGRFQPPQQPSEVQRSQQAAVVNQFVHDILALDAGAGVVVLGDFNDFPFSDSLQMLMTGADAGVELVNLYSLLAEPYRYSYVYDGNSQALDHILVSPGLTQPVEPVFEVVHVTAERAAEDPLRVSDHDPLLASLYPLPTSVSLTPAQASLGDDQGESVVFTLTITNSGPLAAAYDLTLNGNTWPAALDTPEVGPLSAGASAEVEVMVQIPLDALPDAQDTLQVEAVARSLSYVQASVTLTAMVTPLNDIPSAYGASFEMDEDGAYSGTLSGSDSDGDALTFWQVFGPAHGDVQVDSEGSFTYTPDSDYAGTDEFTFRVHDGTAYSLPALVSITVRGENDAPVANSQPFEVDEDHTLAGALTGDDLDGDALTFYVDTLPEHGLLDLELDGSFTYTPDSDYAGPDAFSFYVRDANLVSSPVDIPITVYPVQDAPRLVAALPDRSVLSGVLFSFQIASGAFADPDGDSLTFAAELESGTALPAWLGFNPITRTFSGTPPGPADMMRIRVTASDGTDTASALFNLSILDDGFQTYLPLLTLPLFR